jgi:hypothetical protein
MTDSIDALGLHLASTAPAVLWHYTNLEGFSGISRDHEIFATDIRFLNDTSEYIHALEFIKKRVEVLPEGTESHVLFRKLINGLLSGIHSLERTQVFVSSFSESPDDLSQWRAYAVPPRGVSLGFDMRGPHSGLSSSRVFLHRCVYEENEKNLLVDALFVRIARAIPLLSGQSPDSDVPIEQGLRFGAEIGNIARVATLLKHPKFASEKEWRLVVIERDDIEVNNTLKREFRPGASTVVPYVRLRLRTDDGGLRIRRVMIGPHPDRERAKTAIREQFRWMSSVEIDIEASDVPFRSW